MLTYPRAFQGEVGIFATTAQSPIYSSHFNSWLLLLNYHLVNQPDIMKSLPWIRDSNGMIPFLPTGTPLPGAIMDPRTAKQLGIPLPHHMPDLGQFPSSEPLPVKPQLIPTVSVKSVRPEVDILASYEQERRLAEQIMTKQLRVG